ncbi:protein tyrosine phosphatase [Rhodotorula diobovata]|uniref:Very-long-chain (3R)-3-hydroxyacyl-CoA dehydratase n=1 Tax=Rhodotorula diobovata TaxID=5288 RepID=A0A5C5FQD9_9BASI|nr:protein tyrosine phosphatase [Rhodotorula diobovata]
MAKSTSSSSPRKPTSSRGPSPPVRLYLTGYNLVSAGLWAYVLYRAVEHMAGADGYTGLKEWAGWQGTGETLAKRASGSFDAFGQTVKWIQTAAILEAVHAATGLVRSPLGTTVAQITSRLMLVWGVGELFPEVARSPVYLSMVTAWSFAEIIRYSHYVAGLAGVKVSALEWLRYTAFYVLYPLGAGSEAVLLLKSAGPAKAAYGALAGAWVYFVVCAWPPSLAVMMKYMHSQRRKHVGGASRSSVSSAANKAATPVKAAVKDITSAVSEANVLDATATETPARSTRSRAKKQ